MEFYALMSLKLKMQKFFGLLLGGWMAFSCTDTRQKDKSLLPGSIGAPAEMLVILDSGQWFGSVGDSIVSTLSPNISKLLEPEYLFTLRYIKPDAFMGILQRHNNLLIVTTWQTQSPHSEKLRSFFPKIDEPKRENKIIYETDLFAKGQTAALVFAQDSTTAAQLVGNEKEKLQNFFLKKEAQRMNERLYGKVKPNNEAMAQLKANHGFSLKVPFNYKIEKDTIGFVWLRYASGINDQDILISYKPYTSEKQFNTDSLTAWRDSVYRRHIYVNRIQDPNSYLVTEAKVPLEVETQNFLGFYGKKMRGLWRSNTFALGGGPFTAVAFVSPDGKSMFVIEGFVYAPGSPKREIIRELEAIMATMEFVGQ